MRLMGLCLLLVLGIGPRAEAEDLGLAAPDDVLQSGILKYVLPRFSLKTGVRITPDPGGAMVLGPPGTGTPVLQRGDVVYDLSITDDPRQERFLDWLTSDIGVRTIESFTPDTGPGFIAPAPRTDTVETILFEGDVDQGESLSLTLCGRCHVIGPQNAMNSIGSTPSFGVLRAMSSWDEKFQTFYVLRPHAAFTQIEGVTAPFDPARPSPIAPVEMTLEDLDAILAFVAGVKPADLGAPLQFQ